MCCPNCDEPLENDWDECPVCQIRLRIPSIVCPNSNCGREVKEHWHVCPWCKSALTVDKVASVQKSLSMEFVEIPQGEFMMGCDEGEVCERPAHMVKISEFKIQTTPVTQAQYRAVLGKNPSHFKGDNLPVESITWYGAASFCNKLSDMVGLKSCYHPTSYKCDFDNDGFRLLTEAEWEYACRAGTHTKYWTGNSDYFGDNHENNLDHAAWYRHTVGEGTHPVGEKKPNPWGLFDMHGNVSEWCNDWHGFEYYKKSPVSDPQGPEKGYNHIIRGGSWNTFSLGCSSYARSYCGVDKSDEVGFRIVRR